MCTMFAGLLLGDPWVAYLLPFCPEPLLSQYCHPSSQLQSPLALRQHSAWPSPSQTLLNPLPLMEPSLLSLENFNGSLPTIPFPYTGTVSARSPLALNIFLSESSCTDMMYKYLKPVHWCLRVSCLSVIPYTSVYLSPFAPPSPGHWPF